MKYLLPLLFLACLPELNPDGTIVDYSKEMDLVLEEDPDCREFLEEIVVFETLDPVRFCPPDPVDGCYLYPCNFIFIDVELNIKYKKEVAIHEYIHALLLCSTGNGDMNHENSELWEG